MGNKIKKLRTRKVKSGEEKLEMDQKGYDKQFLLFDQTSGLSHRVYTYQSGSKTYKGFCPICGKQLEIIEGSKNVQCQTCKWIGHFQLELRTETKEKGKMEKKDQKPKAKARKTKLGKRLTEAVSIDEKRAGILEEINKLVKNWKKLSPKEQKPLFNIIKFDLQLLKPEMRDLVRQRLINAKIIRAKAFDELIKKGKTLELESVVEGEKIEQDKIKHEQLTIPRGLIHLINDGEAIKYLFKDEKKGLYVQKDIVRDFYNEDGTLKKRVYYTPSQTLPMGFTTPEVLDLQGKVDFADLLAEVMDYIAQRLEMPNEADYLILALWILHTYLIDKFMTTPILYVTGTKETGKGRLGELISELTFRGQVLTTPTEASLFRSTEYFRPCLVIDEVKLWGFGANEPVACLMNNRYKRGVKVCRIERDRKGEKQVEFYDCYGCTVITTTESIKPALRSRCIEFVMQKNENPEVEKPLDYQQAQILRNKLTVFRAEFIGKDLPAYEQIARGRLNEILLPLYQVLISVKPAWQPKFKEIIKTLRGQKKVEESLSLEYDILQVIVDELGGQIGDLCILTQDIGKEINKGIGDKAKPVSDKAIGFRCKRLGFEVWRDRNQGGRMGFRIKRELLAPLVERYEIELTEKPVNKEA